MSLWKIAWVSLAERRLSSLLTGLSMALGVALVVAVLVIHGVVHDSFQRAAHGYDLIVGAKGGRLQLVLNTVYHLSQPIENIPWSYYREFADPDGRFASQVAVAIPYCLGDNYEGFRVVGTRPEMFEKLEYAAGKPYRFRKGRNFRNDAFFEAVIGSVVARRTGLAVGDRFQPTHGLAETGHLHEHDSFQVVGVLAPTGTPNDRALFVNIEGFFLLDGHAKPVEEAAAAEPAADAAAAAHEKDHAHDAAHDDAHTGDEAAAHAEEDHAHEHQPDDAHPGHPDHARDEDHTHDEDHAHENNHTHHEVAHGEDAHQHAADHYHEEQHGHAPDHQHDHRHAHGQPDPLPEAQREVTAVLVRSSNVLAGLSLPRMINKESVAQAVMPVREITSLFEGVVGNLHLLLLALAVLVVIVAAIGIMVAIYNTMNERRREIAVMRALGADRRTVMRVVLLESVLLALAGGLAGVLLGHGLIGLLNPWIVDQTGVTIPFWRFAWQELALIPGLILLATLAGYLPALNAYRTDVARALSTAP